MTSAALRAHRTPDYDLAVEEDELQRPTE